MRGLCAKPDGRKGIYGNIVIRKSMNEEAYAILEDFDLSLLKRVYELVGKEALKDDEKCPPTFESGLRIPSIAEEFVERIRTLSREPAAPERIAAAALRFPIWRQPFKNCNHRTGYAMCSQVLGLFGLGSTASKDEIVKYVFSINKYSYSEEEVETWIRGRIR